jgi:hypothetical protein
MKNANPLYAILFLIVLTLFTSCDEKQNTNETTKYSDSDNWILNPDSISKEVDVFYVYPTVIRGTENLIMDLNNKAQRNVARINTMEQIGVFANTCNMFAPYYRQVSLDVLTMPEDTLNKYFAFGHEDVIEAFNYYLNNLNNGRPFFIAGHSQGSMNLIELMKKQFNNTEISNKLIAAYLIGYSVTDEDLEKYPWMKIAKSENDNGVIITYNTQSADAIGSPVLLEGANCVNPLSWTRSSEIADNKLNLGAAFFSETGNLDSIVPHFTNAWIDENGALVAGNVDVNEYSGPAFPKGVYHKNDYNFFYKNLEQNIGVRVDCYLRRK